MEALGSSAPAELLPRYFHKNGAAAAQCGGVFHVDGTYRSSSVSEHVNINRAFFPSLTYYGISKLQGTVN